MKSANLRTLGTASLLIMTLMLQAWGVASAADRGRTRRPKKKAPEAAAQTDSDFEDFEDEYGESSPKGQAASPISDPFGGFNRAMFVFNDKFYFWVGKPLTKGYGLIFPTPVRSAFDRGFTNLKFPLRFVSSALQGKWAGTGRELGRFLLNSTVGIGGLFDPAGAWLDWEPSDEDLGQVMGFYGIGGGWPLVLPILGPTNVRDGLGTLPNSFLNPVYWVTEGQTFMYVTGGDKFNYLSLHGEEYEKMKKDALDPYTFFRDIYKQHRDKKISE